VVAFRRNQWSDSFGIPGRITPEYAKILFKFDFNTWQAYNYWGGGSLYSHDRDPVSLTPTDTIAVDRPIAWPILQPISWGFTYFLNAISSVGHTMDYCNNIDVDSLPSGPNDLEGINLLLKYKMLVIYYHDEYWSSDERANVEAFKGQTYGGNIARFAPNTCYWRINWWPNTRWSGHMKLYCRKDNWPDQQNHPPLDLWRYHDSLGGLNNPEAKFLGEQYEKTWSRWADGEPPDTVYNHNHWIFNGIGFHKGSPFGYGFLQSNVRHGLTSGEWDNTFAGRADFPLDTLAQAWMLGADSTIDLVQMVYYEDTLSNARVFAEGHSGWNNAVSDSADHPDDVLKMKIITANIFDHFSGKKYIGKLWATPVRPWDANVELDGNVYLLSGRTLTLTNNMTLTVDSGDTLFVDGTLQVPSSANLSGGGIIKIGTGGKINVDGTLQINSSMSVSGTGLIQVNSTGKINVNNYFTVNSGVTLQLNAGSSLLFGSSSSRLLVYGNLIVNGTPASRVTIDGQGYARSGSSMPTVAVASGATANIQYADFKNAAYELTLWYSTASVTVQNCTFTNFGLSSIAQAITVQSKTTGPATISSNKFTGSNSQGTGIYCYNTGTNVTISGNTITSAGTGIRCSSSDAFLTSDTVRNNVNYGINANNVSTSAQYRRNDIRANGYGISLSSASPYLMYNVVIQNGLNVLINSCSPEFGTLPSEGDNRRGHNTIAHAGAPLLRAQNSASPILGYMYNGGINSIFDCDLPHLWVVNHSGVCADSNFWKYGEELVPTYYADGTSWAMVRNPLATNRNPDPLGRGMASGEGIAAMSSITVGSAADTTLENAFRTAVNEAINGDPSKAASELKILIQSGSAKYAQLALLFYHDLASGRWNWTADVSQVKADVSSLLQDLRSQPVSTFLRPFALRLLSRDAAVSKDDGLANIYRMEILKDYPESEHELTTLYDLIVYYVEGEDNLQMAHTLLGKMIKSYPDENLTYMARIELGETVNLPGSGKTQPAVAIDQSPGFMLDPSYPNPFNPSTTFRFRIHEAGPVSLKIFDFLGREVAVLLNDFRPAGSYSIAWNAGNLASGVYISRLQAGGKVAIQKHLLVK